MPLRLWGESEGLLLLLFRRIGFRLAGSGLGIRLVRFGLALGLGLHNIQQLDLEDDQRGR